MSPFKLTLGHDPYPRSSIEDLFQSRRRWIYSKMWSPFDSTPDDQEKNRYTVILWGNTQHIFISVTFTNAKCYIFLKNMLDITSWIWNVTLVAARCYMINNLGTICYIIFWNVTNVDGQCYYATISDMMLPSISNITLYFFTQHTDTCKFPPSVSFMAIYVTLRFFHDTTVEHHSDGSFTIYLLMWRAQVARIPSCDSVILHMNLGSLRHRQRDPRACVQNQVQYNGSWHFWRHADQRQWPAKRGHLSKTLAGFRGSQNTHPDTVCNTTGLGLPPRAMMVCNNRQVLSLRMRYCCFGQTTPRSASSVH